MRKPNFFIVGAPRCGTSAMYAYLGKHPEIFTARNKEPHFFGSDNIYPRRPTLKQYLACFAGADGRKRVGEASTSYLFSRLAAGEIKEFSPSARIIIMLRDPVETMYSIHGMVLYYRDEDIEDFEAALAAEVDRKQGLRWPKWPHIVNYLYYRDAVRYTGQVRRYFDQFGRENVHVIVYDDFAAWPAKAYRETLQFLGVDPNFQPQLESINSSRKARSKPLQHFLLHPRLAALRERVLPRRLDEIVFGGLRGLNTVQSPRPPMDPELKRKLKAEFRPEVERLSTLLGRDLTHWCKE